MERRCVLVLGGEIGDYGKVKSLFRDDDCFVFCDRGLRHLDRLSVKASLAVGDFDSFPPPSGVESIVFPPEKDDTDALIGIKEALRRGYRNYLIVGAFGGRIDHSLANVYLLDYLYSRGCSALISDGNTELSVVGGEWTKVSAGCIYFSLLALFGKAEGVYIRGAEYNLENAVIVPQEQYGISNEVTSSEAFVRVEKGRLLLVRTESEAL